MAPPPPNWKALRAALWQRAQGRCEVTGLPLDPETFDAHHRRNKGIGGTSRPDRDALSNLLALDPLVHNGHTLTRRTVHGDPEWSRLGGYLLSNHGALPPAAQPVWLHGVRWVWLTDDGEYAWGFDYSGLPNA